MSQAVIHVRIARDLGEPRPQLLEADTIGIELICDRCGENSLIITCDEQQE